MWIRIAVACGAITGKKFSRNYSNVLNFRLRGQVHLASYSPLDAAQSDIEKSFSLHPSVQTALLAAQILIYKNEFTQALKMYQIGMNSF